MATRKRDHNKKHMCVSCGDTKLKFHPHVTSCVGATREGACDLLRIEHARVDSLRLKSYTVEELKDKYGKAWPMVAHAYVSAGIPIKIKHKKAVNSVKDLQSFLIESKIGQFALVDDGHVAFEWLTEQEQSEANPASTSTLCDQGKTNESDPKSASGVASESNDVASESSWTSSESSFEAASESSDTESESGIIRGTTVQRRGQFIEQFWPDIKFDTKTPSAKEYTTLVRENPKFGLSDSTRERKNFQSTFLQIVNNERVSAVVNSVVGPKPLTDPDYTFRRILVEKKWMSKKTLMSCKKMYAWGQYFFHVCPEMLPIQYIP